MKKKILSAVLTAAMLMTLFTGCGTVSSNEEIADTEINGAEEKNTEAADAEAESTESKTVEAPAMEQVNNQTLNIIDDNYRTCYEVFVYSFYDSDGDGIGDLQGLISKLDYINDGDDTTDTDLGCNEIWLMPIMPSTTYHKYDVTDYENIDTEYGTLEDFDELIEECHNRGINVLIDFVMNHTSSQHEWFTAACAYLESLEPGEEPDLNECPYVDYYNFSREQKAAYEQVGNSEWYYEAQFWSEMPDLNLASGAVRGEFEDIVQFWLDRGVDGFRLDAVKEYYTNADAQSIEVLTWFTDMVKSKKEDAYLVGEAWTDYTTYAPYYKSGIDSMFNFSFGENDGYICKVLNGTAKSKASTYGKAIVAVQDLIQEYNPNGIDAPFYTNHDMGRSAGYYSGDYAENKVKMAQAMNLLMSGNAFLYYGEEIGMKGAGADENKRVGMYWSKDASAEGMCDGPADADAVEMIYDSLEEQQEDPYSIYNFVQQTIKLRNIYPEIARGTVTFNEELSDENICVLTKDYNGSELMLVFNLSEEDCDVDLSAVSLNGKSAGELEVAGILQTDEKAPEFSENTAVVPAYSVLLLK